MRRLMAFDIEFSDGKRLGDARANVIPQGDCGQEIPSIGPYPFGDGKSCRHDTASRVRQ